MSSSSVLPRKHLCGIDKADGWVDCSIFVVGVVDVSVLSQDGSDCWRSRRASVIPALSWCARFSRSLSFLPSSYCKGQAISPLTHKCLKRPPIFKFHYYWRGLKDARGNFCIVLRPDLLHCLDSDALHLAPSPLLLSVSDYSHSVQSSDLFPY
jgi:hypothetical protein